ncbi:metalloregulator ArsR/SmtB family transcription factor [Mycolicibacterium sp. F2034L]|uniref:ArsR/SmtB family transcription factor n=1 Tax=Mycolicibacterium sp. F2034L TaxID=2926422 RepID=UPI001FF12BD7|nr:metalloregulator ArsR/SmtB family transcription factor [Mycolicibacterium sp. F2034L]MCK0174170.1 metalloregulator ArsR/SmtB family transcription factor [Mycolicibacterium sp. F2034L]
MDKVFKALADPSRRRLLDNLNWRNGQTLRDLCAGLQTSRQSVSKHLAVLESADLVTTVRRGREKLHYLNVEPINAVSDRWINQYDRARIQVLADLETALETPPTHGSEPFVYTSYIRTTPERLWQAVTDPAYSARYLGHAMHSSWEKGAAYTWVDNGLEIAHPDQIVLESDPYARLAYTFHTFVPEIASIAEVDAQTLAQAAVEQRSRVTLDIEQVDGQVRLTLTHDGFDPGGVVRPLISAGWPYKLSTLKTGLEQG